MNDPWRVYEHVTQDDTPRRTPRRYHRLVLGVATIASCIALLYLVAWRDWDHDANAQAVAEEHYSIVPRHDEPYVVTPVAEVGRVTGTVVLRGAPGGDTVAVIPEDKNGCAKELTMNYLVRGPQGGVQDVVVWLPDIRHGRALPEERRFTLNNHDCAWTPMVQVVAASGTLNLVNLDSLVDRAVIRSAATGHIISEAPFTNEGQVVPFNRILRTPSVYQFSIASRPESRSWVMVLDHPYFTISGEDGAFALEGVPVGEHAIRAWHPVAGLAYGMVRVLPDQAATVELEFAR